MAFQNSVRADLTTGYVGEIAYGSAIRATSFSLNSSDQAQNIIGRYFTVNADGTVAAGGAGDIAGIMINPKGQVSQGTSAGTLQPTLQVNNNKTAEFLSNGIVYVNLATAAVIGDLVTYSTTTGALDRVAKGTSAAPSGYAFVPNCRVTHVQNTGNGLSVVTINN
jgi:hypothetical protein